MSRNIGVTGLGAMSVGIARSSLLAVFRVHVSAVDIFVQGLGLVLDTARRSKFPFPLSATTHQMFMMASTAGHGWRNKRAML